MFPGYFGVDEIHRAVCVYIGMDESNEIPLAVKSVFIDRPIGASLELLCQIVQSEVD
jgi:hypothetical protein